MVVYAELTTSHLASTPPSSAPAYLALSTTFSWNSSLTDHPSSSLFLFWPTAGFSTSNLYPLATGFLFLKPTHCSLIFAHPRWWSVLHMAPLCTVTSTHIPLFHCHTITKSMHLHFLNLGSWGATRFACGWSSFGTRYCTLSPGARKGRITALFQHRLLLPAHEDLSHHFTAHPHSTWIPHEH